MASISQPLGAPSSTTPALIVGANPKTTTLAGKNVTLRPLVIGDAKGLYEVLCGPGNDQLWTYIPGSSPFSSLEDFTAYIQTMLDAYEKVGDFAFAIQLTSGKLVGVIVLMNNVAAQRRCEVGHVVYSKSLQRTSAATEAVFLIVKYAFELGNERVEWKCDDKNAPSGRAAERYGFRYEGTFLKHMAVKGHRRDTAWFSIIDDEWNGGIKSAFQAWLSDDNFDGEGNQKKKLENIRAEIFKKLE